MISEDEYKKAVKQHEEAEKIINQYHAEKQNNFNNRIKNNPIFSDEELIYSAKARCSCGAGLAYPRNCGPSHYWDCSNVLKGIADKTIKHTERLPFIFYEVKCESAYNGSTRPKKED